MVEGAAFPALTIGIEKIFKAPFRGGRYGHTIDEATKSLQDAVKDFEIEARICDSQRLGQVDLVTRRTLLTAAHIETETKKTGQGVTQLSHGKSKDIELFCDRLPL